MDRAAKARYENKSKREMTFELPDIEHLEEAVA